MGRNRVQIGPHGDEGGIDAIVERGSVLNFVQSLVDHVDTGHAGEDHSREVARYAGLVADEMELSSAERWRACAAARLHDTDDHGVATSWTTALRKEARVAVARARRSLLVEAVAQTASSGRAKTIARWLRTSSSVIVSRCS
jgi:hypothetical protein